MLVSGKIASCITSGKESLRILEESKEDPTKQNGKDISDAIVRENVQPRSQSIDVEKIPECRKELLLETSRHESDKAFLCSESMCESSLHISSDTNSVSQIPVSFRNNENAQKNCASP